MYTQVLYFITNIICITIIRIGFVKLILDVQTPPNAVNPVRVGKHAFVTLMSGVSDANNLSGCTRVTVIKT